MALPGVASEATLPIFTLPSGTAAAVDPGTSVLPKSGKTHVLVADLDGETVYLSTNGYATATAALVHEFTGRVVPQHQLFRPALLGPLSVTTSLAKTSGDAGLRSETIPGFGIIRLANTDGSLDDLTNRSWAGRRVEVYRGDLGDNFADLESIFVGRAARASTPDLTQAEIHVRDFRQRISKPVQDRLYSGMGGAIRGAPGASVDIGMHPSCLIEGDLTVEFRYRGFEEAMDSVGIATYDNASSGAWSVKLHTSNDTLTFQHGAIRHNYTVMVRSGIWTDGEWHHGAIVRDRDNAELRFYIDGELLSTVDMPTLSFPSLIDGRLSLGCSSGPTFRLHSGDLDEIRVWRSIRTPQEIDANKERQISATNADLAGYWRFDEQVGTTTFDEVGTTDFGVKTQRALRLNGAGNTRAIVPHNPLFDSRSFTFRVVCFPWRAPFNTTQYIASINGAFRLEFRPNGRIRFTVLNGPGSNFFVTAPADQLTWERRWHYFDIRFNPTQMRIYESGRLIAERATGFERETPSQALVMGGFGGGGASGIWLAEAAWFARSRTVDDLTGDWQARLTGLESNLVSHWLFDESSGTTFRDSGPSNLDGAISGAAYSWHNSNGEFEGGASWIGSAGGGAELADKPIPTLTGHMAHIEMAEVDAIGSVWQIAEGPLESIDEVQVGGNPVTLGPDVKDVWAHTFSGDQDCVQSKARGLVRFRVPPGNPPTATAKGDSTLGYDDSVLGVLRNLAERRSDIGHNEFNSSDDRFVDVLSPPGGIGVHTGTSPVKLTNLLNQVMRSVNGAWGFRRDGSLFALRFIDPTTADATFALSGDDILRGSVRRQAIPPSWRQTILYRQYTGHLSASEVDTIGIAAPSIRADVQEEWREASAEDASILGANPGAADVRSITAIQSRADAQKEVEGRLELFKVPRFVYEIRTIRDVMADVGDVVRLTLPRYGLDNGRNLLVIGWSEDAGTDGVPSYSITLWG